MSSSLKSGDDVLELLDSLDKDIPSAATSESVETTTSTNKASKDDDDILGFLDSLTDSTKKPESSSAETSVKPAVEKQPDNNPNTPSKALDNKSEPSSAPIESQKSDPISSLTSWWSKNKDELWTSATTAVKQAEAKVRELQPEVTQNPKHALESLNESIFKLNLKGGIIQSTLNTVLETIAPPISRHERLQIHVFHDMVGYPTIDNIVYSVFERVMQQVEGGGDLTMIVQKGKERHKIGTDKTDKRELYIFKGPVDHAHKLAAASVEEFLRSGKDVKGDKATKVKTAVDEDGRMIQVTEDNTDEDSFLRLSNIYLSIQPCSTDSEHQQSSEASKKVNLPVVISSSSPRTFQFVVYLKDPTHNIEFSTVSQSFPYQWAEWLDSPDSSFEDSPVDPREWVIDWVEEGLGLAIGIIAQTYVSKRMGMGDIPTTTASTSPQIEAN